MSQVLSSALTNAQYNSWRGYANGLPRLLYETLRVACFPVGARWVQVA
ncbi:hypothetical protein [Nostoc sp.]